ncbi:hypothetical protein MGALJ_48130 [Mycobacterium gallinarum]|uniref:Uncharacterized protein n=1 Tax=Mycobacterium gallinarum TaxID=39689 RepID=A0A9W4BMZ7_9MYCO|nr:hypothetical protein MGALJ_48130 [Mycobacterium gallinarum]
MYDVVPVLGRDGDDGDIDSAETFSGLPNFGHDVVEPALVEIDEIDFVYRGDEMPDAQKFCDPGMPVGLSQHAGAGVHEQDGRVGV